MLSFLSPFQLHLCAFLFLKKSAQMTVTGPATVIGPATVTGSVTVRATRCYWCS